jgi:hypothetical protein
MIEPALETEGLHRRPALFAGCGNVPVIRQCIVQELPGSAADREDQEQHQCQHFPYDVFGVQFM